MKAYKKIISFILTLVMMLSLSVNVFAAEPLTDDPNMIEWKYTVFADESLQKVVEEGVIPNAYARYTWRGITLKNGEVAILTPSNNSMGLYCNSGRYITINYTLNLRRRQATVPFILMLIPSRNYKNGRLSRQRFYQIVDSY